MLETHTKGLITLLLHITTKVIVIQPILQVALDILETERAIEIATEAIAGGAEWIEAGTPLIKSEGMDSVRKLREAFPDKTIVADMKIQDTGTLEVEMASKAGADVITILATADNATVEDALQAAHKYGTTLMVDLLCTKNWIVRAKELERLGVGYINFHTGIDQQMRGEMPLKLLKNVDLAAPIAIAGGIDAETAAQAVSAGASIIIVGGNITRSENVTESTKKIISAMHKPQTTVNKKTDIQKEIIRLLENTSTPNISDAIHRKGAMKNVKSMIAGQKIVGQAVTVQTFEGDWAKPVEAIDIAKPGEIIVIYNASKHVAPWGELASLSCINKGIAGVIIDGAVRDIDDIRKLKFPVFACSTVPNAGEPKGMGEINVEIVCGGQTVRQGDYIAGDDNGVVVIPKEQAYEIARRAVEVAKTEQRIREEIKRGKTLSQVLHLEKWEKMS
ncbi:MAG: 3-keto-L-gulonate-6-phosphate decarboxylase UlaD [Candidatus Argoarchaeum ethanivorans]|uniref:3-hexulose-6-phosphate synthase n=1 Tax=Candidatus Argoarchaeum ethanivorans TaxID=2608793 RepID=A0A812A0T0_9EURY|nr:MAG: 3-keto-L-gulonate-6-phosphate decarboxylase UlaD [Candidatus Argoarchaeum ethanivorans]